MKKSVGVGLTVLAAFGVSARAKQLDPCAAATFNEVACQAAIQNRGYCWNGRWVRMKYRQPYPYYFDVYDEFVATGGIATPVEVGTCSQAIGDWIHLGRRGFAGAHGSGHGGFGSTACGHAAHG
jgi:hypothetical protein